MWKILICQFRVEPVSTKCTAIDLSNSDFRFTFKNEETPPEFFNNPKSPITHSEVILIVKQKL